jgi:hypothetical protein
MSPIVIIVFAPVVVLGLVFYSILTGAALAGIWEAAERRAEKRFSAPRPASLHEDKGANRAPRATSPRSGAPDNARRW